MRPTTIHESSYLQDCDDWTVEVYDVEAAFLNADAGHKQYIYVPEAMIKTGLMTIEKARKMVYELHKSIYGNMDAALRFFETYHTILVNKMKLKNVW